MMDTGYPRASTLWFLAKDTIRGFVKIKLFGFLIVGFAVAAVFLCLIIPFALSPTFSLILLWLAAWPLRLGGTLLALMVFGVFLVKRLEGREVGVYFSRPMNRFEFITGRVLGSILFVLLYVLLASILEGLLAVVAAKAEGGDSNNIVRQWLQLSIGKLSFAGFLLSGFAFWLRTIMLGLEVLLLRMMGMNTALAILISLLATSAWGSLLIVSFGNDGWSGTLGSALYMILPSRDLLDHSRLGWGEAVGKDYYLGLAYGISWILFFFATTAYFYQNRDLAKADQG